MFWRRIKYAGYNAVVAAVLLMGLVGGIQGALYVGIFAVWVHFVAGMCVLFVPEAAEPMRVKGPTVPQWVDVCVDLFFVVLLVWHAWFISGAAYLLSMIFMHHAQYGAPKHVVP